MAGAGALTVNVQGMVFPFVYLPTVTSKGTTRASSECAVVFQVPIGIQEAHGEVIVRGYDVVYPMHERVCIVVGEEAKEYEFAGDAVWKRVPRGIEAVAIKVAPEVGLAYEHLAVFMELTDHPFGALPGCELVGARSMHDVVRGAAPHAVPQREVRVLEWATRELVHAARS